MANLTIPFHLKGYNFNMIFLMNMPIKYITLFKIIKYNKLKKRKWFTKNKQRCGKLQFGMLDS